MTEIFIEDIERKRERESNYEKVKENEKVFEMKREKRQPQRSYFLI